MEYPMTINRTAPEVRIRLNKVLLDKRTIFEGVIIKQVRELLNSTKATLELEERQNLLYSLASSRRKRDEQRFFNAANAIQKSTQNAPMGIGSATGLALDAVKTANQLYYENNEQKILEKSAEENLNAAKLQIYTPKSDNYTIIAKKVARELSFSLQPLLLVLAAGESGIVKLANFTQKSRKKYAVEKLAEYHSTNSVQEIVNALVDASIPPVADDAFYRDFFDFDINKCEVKLRKHTTLNHDPEVQNLLTLAGLDAEIFFGQLCANKYTIIGALNHAVFLGQNYELYAGIETPHRSNELITGILKYPLRLVPPTKNIGAASVSFAPRPTGIELEKAHVDFLKKLFPDFADPNALKISDEELKQDEVILPDYSLRKYHCERHSVPWNQQRAEDRQKRLYMMLSTNLVSGSKEAIYSIPDYPKLLSLRDAGDLFDLNYAKNDLLKGFEKTQANQIKSFTAFENLSKNKFLLESAKYSKYLAMSTNNYIYCLIKCQMATHDDLTFAKEMLDNSRNALNLSRTYPLIEANNIFKARKALNIAINKLNESSNMQFACYKNLENFLKNYHVQTDNYDFLHISSRISGMKKKMLDKIRVINQEIINTTDFINILCQNSLAIPTHEALTEEEALKNFSQAANILVFNIYSPASNNSAEILQKIRICDLETRIIHSQITAILNDPELRPNNFEELDTQANAILNQTSKYLSDANKATSETTYFQKKLIKTKLINRLRSILTDTKEQRDACEAIFINFNLNHVGREEDQETLKLLKRMQAYNQFGRILFLVKNLEPNNLYKQNLQNLKKSISILYRTVEKKIKDHLISYQNLNEEFKDINPQSSLESIFKAINKLKTAKQKMDIYFANDTDILNKMRQQGIACFDRVKDCIQEMQAINRSLLSIIDDAEQTLLNQSAIDNQLPEKIASLISLLTDEDLAENKADENHQECSDLKEKICQIINNFYDTKSFSYSQFAQEIKDFLNKIPKNNQRNCNQLIPLDRDISIDKLSPLTLDLKGADLGPINSYETWVISKLLNLIIKDILNSEQGLKNNLQIIDQSIHLIQTIIEKEPKELIAARSMAIGKIKQAYQCISYAVDEKTKLIENTPSDCISANVLIATNLEWAVRPNFNELEYLDQKNLTLRKSRFEKQQKYKDDNITLNPILINYLKIGIEYLKKQEEVLKKLKRNIKKDLDSIYEPDTHPLNHLNHHINNPIHEQLKKLGKIVEEKINLINQRIRCFEQYKHNITKNILKIYFDYLKLEVDILEPEIVIGHNKKVTQKLTLFKNNNHILAKKPSLVHIEDEKIITAAKKRSITQLENHYHELKLSLINNQTSSAKITSLTDSTSDQSEDKLAFPRQKNRPNRISHNEYNSLGNFFLLTEMRPENNNKQRPLIFEIKSPQT